jgi:hypothetical protein
MDWTIYGALIVGAIALTWGAAHVAIRCLRAWRDFKRFRRHLAKSLQALADSADATSRTAERVAGDQTALESSLGRLRVALAQFNVLLAALDEVGDTFRRVTAVYPRK